MKRRGKKPSASVVISSTTQCIETRRPLADLVIGGLLVALVIGGLAM
jgi:hypothetical protein